MARSCFLQGKPLSLSGPELKAGQTAPDATLKKDLTDDAAPWCNRKPPADRWLWPSRDCQFDSGNAWVEPSKPTPASKLSNVRTRSSNATFFPARACNPLAVARQRRK